MLSFVMTLKAREPRVPLLTLDFVYILHVNTFVSMIHYIDSQLRARVENDPTLGW